ncbi:MAG: hypothetical protein FJ295_15655 [Planctomycetes bacterium]|nr:hypothetical protein [Planctomycetota bacterium]
MISQTSFQRPTALFVASVAALLWCNAAEARTNRITQNEARSAEVASAASPSDQSTASGDCKRCCDRCIKYRHHPTLHKICCGCEESTRTVLQVTDPCCRCVVEVEVCLPACCDDCPKVCCSPGLLGRDVVTYEWCCGYKVRVVFDRCGDITVHSYGR